MDNAFVRERKAEFPQTGWHSRAALNMTNVSKHLVEQSACTYLRETKLRMGIDLNMLLLNQLLNFSVCTRCGLKCTLGFDEQVNYQITSLSCEISENLSSDEVMLIFIFTYHTNFSFASISL